MENALFVEGRGKTPMGILVYAIAAPQPWWFDPVCRSRLGLVAGIWMEDSGPSSDFNLCFLWPHSLGAAQMLIAKSIFRQQL